MSLAKIIFLKRIIRIKKGDRNIKISFSVSYYKTSGKGYHSSYDLVYTPQKDIVAKDIYTLIKYLDDDLRDFLRKYNIISKEQDYIFKFGKKDSIVTYKPLTIIPKNNLIADYTQLFSRKLSKLLGYEGGDFVKSPELIYELESIYVYSDIVEASCLGNQSVHLLDLLPGDNVYCTTQF